MLKPISNLLSRTPWWGLIGFGLGTIVLLVLLAIPINVLRLEARDTTAAEGRAIQREMDAAFEWIGFGRVGGDHHSAFRQRPGAPR